MRLVCVQSACSVRLMSLTGNINPKTDLKASGILLSDAVGSELPSSESVSESWGAASLLFKGLDLA